MTENAVSFREEQKDSPPTVGFCEAKPGDYCVVQFAKFGTEWYLGEVVACTKQYSRVKLMKTPTGEERRVGPRDKIFIGSEKKLDLERAKELFEAAPDEGVFTTWDDARRYLVAAKKEVQ